MGELLTADKEGIESVRAVGAVLEQIFLRLCQFLASLVLVEAVPTACHSSRLEGQNKVVVILPVEERHKALLSGESLVDEKVLLVVAHRVAEID